MENFEEAPRSKYKRKRKSRKLKRQEAQEQAEAVPETGGNLEHHEPQKRKCEEIMEPEEPQPTKFKHLKGMVPTELRRALREMNFKHLMEIQQKAIPVLLNGLDVVGTAKTGSGKTLAFLVPAIQRLVELGEGWGTGALVISPTRELAEQTYSVALSLTAHLPSISVGLVMGKQDLVEERRMLKQRPSLLVGTPGRLQDHILRTWGWGYDTVRCLIIDEADKILNQGFVNEMKTILKHIPAEERQTMLFSATMTIRTKELVDLALKPNHVWVSAGLEDPTLTVEGLEQKFVVAPVNLRLTILATVLWCQPEKKKIVFFNSVKAVDFHYAVFLDPEFELSNIIKIHGKMEQAERKQALQQFIASSEAVLFCTDLASRGLDIPEVDFVFQFEPPTSIDDYIHRVGRTARGVGGTGKAMILLQPHELKFVEHLQQLAIPITQKKHKATEGDVEASVHQKLVSQNEELRALAEEAYQAYFKTYNLIHLKDCFEICRLDQQAVAQSLGLLDPPPLDMEISMKKAKMRKKLSRRNLTRNEG